MWPDSVLLDREQAVEKKISVTLIPQATNFRWTFPRFRHVLDLHYVTQNCEQLYYN